MYVSTYILDTCKPSYNTLYVKKTVDHVPYPFYYQIACPMSHHSTVRHAYTFVQVDRVDRQVNFTRDQTEDCLFHYS